MKYIGLMSLPSIDGHYPTAADEQYARDLAALTFGIGSGACFAEVTPGDPWWMLLHWMIRPGLVKVYQEYRSGVCAAPGEVRSW